MQSESITFRLQQSTLFIESSNPYAAKKISTQIML